MRHSGGLRYDEANEAAWEAARGAVVGASRWALYGAAVTGAGFLLSPIYRGLTFQFKVFVQMSAMIMGGCLGADRRLREYELRVRMRKRMEIDRATWEKFERGYEEEGGAAAAAAAADTDRKP